MKEFSKDERKLYALTDEDVEVITQYSNIAEEYEKASHNLYEHFKEKYIGKITMAKTLAELEAIKNELRAMPESSGKVLIFRSILICEDKINKFII